LSADPVAESIDETRVRGLVLRQLVRQWRVFSIDVETNPADGDRIFKIGAVRSDSDAVLSLPTRRLGIEEVVRHVDALADDAELLVGHNVRRHDVVQLRRQYPGLRCLQLPVLDTLELSAIAFPTNPYHRLVKGYKLLSDSRNDPVKDARVALDLLGDEVEALAEMERVDPDWAALLHFLLAHEVPLDRLMRAIRGNGAPSAGAAATMARQRFGSLCCTTRLERFGQNDAAAQPEQKMALAYALGWTRVSGGNSVMPIWVNRAMPLVRSLVAELREHDCRSASCGYCQQQHNPDTLLQLHFQKPGFRDKPAARDGTSLQRAIVQAGLERKSLLAVLPTGGGKSICYQLPALVHYWRAGQLTVIVSPLQSLMKDQVDNLLAAGVHCAVTINGLLTPLERRAALDKIRLGDAGIVLVSPEQFRSRTFSEAIRMRDIAAWVFDEAHCLSKWGHDFRTDYLYVSRYIREHFAHQRAPVGCFTATAKIDVIEDLCAHFQDSLGITLQRFLGGHERGNLSFLILPSKRAEKSQRIIELLRHELKDGGAGIVFCATRNTAEAMAEMVTAQGIPCGCFHGGLEPDRKKTIQQGFLEGSLSVIAATNAFGMGVDKPDVRLVVHADIPGSLENYLQEAGRAGRDGASALCVLLFDEEDVETQFRLSAASELTQRDFVGLLKAAKARVQRMKTDEIVVSAKELLADSEGTGIEIDAPDATTKVTTAVAWLERSGFLKRSENNSRVFPASLRVASLQEAIEKIDKGGLPVAARERCVAVATALFRSVSPGGLSTDELMLDAGIPADECFRIVGQLETFGILANDLGLTVRVAKGVKGASDITLQNLDRLERELLDLMAELAPDADVDGVPQHLTVRPLCTELRRRMGLDESDARVNPQTVRGCLRSLSESFGSGTEKRSMLHLRGMGPDGLRIVLHRPWSQIRAICERRRAVAHVVLARLLINLPPGSREGALIVECKARELLGAIEADLELGGTLREPALALEHALLYMHENRVIEMDKGRSVFRSAMTLKFDPAALKRRFTKEDFAPLQEFYRERTSQTHIIHEYARLGAEDPERAKAFVAAYFASPRRQFLREYFWGRSDMLQLATTDESYRRIVDDLQHPAQETLVQMPERGNHLVLAGPGSGKTRVIVHRIAYLLRVKRVPPEHIIALAFNRSAAISLKRRLLALAGDDAKGVTVMTYHAMALRLTGTSLAAADRKDGAVDFKRLLQDAVDLLEGKQDAFSDADEARDRLLQGYEHILVDEYQDIDAQEYALVSALAGRRLADPDAKLSIMAVGDDDQNIYGFKGANVEFIRRFQDDYAGQVTYLVENFRSTQNIISAANHIIQRATERMKVDHPIRIDSRRSADLPGGRWEALDGQTRGKVRLVSAPGAANLQAQLVLEEISRVRRLDPEMQFGDIAVLARRHETLQPLRSLCDVEGLRYELTTRDGARGQLPLMRSREGSRILALLHARNANLVSMTAVSRWVRFASRREPANVYWADIASAIEEAIGDSSSDSLPASMVIDALYEASGEAVRHGSKDALKLMTVHGAKGLEFKFVLVMDCGDWGWSDEDRRLLYVAMTRAREMLTLFKVEDGRNPFLADLGTIDGVASLLPAARPSMRPDIERRYLTYGPADVDIGYAGRHPASHPIHAAMRQLRVGSDVAIRKRRIETPDGKVVLGRLAAALRVEPRDGALGTVYGVMVRTRHQTPAQYLASVAVDHWEVPLIEVVEGRDDSGKGK
jgi:ATP-dependent DNA helicase RecQ